MQINHGPHMAVTADNCRHCHVTVEKMGHISGASPKVKDYKIRRHNAIVNCVAEKNARVRAKRCALNPK